jgi:multimeric flavodoxin WrbA
MKILAVCGSHREISNTNKIVKKVAESSGYEFDLVYLGKLDIKPCTGCANCMMNEGQCAVNDDMQGLYEKLMETDALILGGPTYFMDISGAVKDFIDRSSAIFYRGVGPAYNPDMPWLGQRPLYKKPAVVVTTVAGGGHERAMETLSMCIGDIHKMDIVAKLAEVVRMDDVDDLPEVLQRAGEAGKKLGESLKQD